MMRYKAIILGFMDKDKFYCLEHIPEGAQNLKPILSEDWNKPGPFCHVCLKHSKEEVEIITQWTGTPEE